MTKKPSLTKQIGDALGTQDKREQLASIQRLQQVAQVPPVAVTVIVTAAGVNVSVTAPIEVSGDDVKMILNQGVDKITAMMVRADLAAQEKPVEELDDGPQEGEDG